MAKPRWLKRSLAILAIVLYIVDTGSDTFVGVDLVNRCHYRYAGCVFTFVALPGIMFGGWLFKGFIINDLGYQVTTKGYVGLLILGTLLGPVVLLIMSLFYLFQGAWNIDDTEIERNGKKIKSLEMVLESFPQFMISLFIMRALQLKETLNIFSCAISGVSVLYGLGDFLALWANDQDPDYPFSKTMWGVLSIFIDTVLRCFTISYWMTINKAYVALVPFVYTILFVVILNSKESGYYQRMVWYGSNIAGSALVSMPSFVCSSLEPYTELDYRVRPISKSIFASIFVAFSIAYGFSVAPKVFTNNLIDTNHTIKFQPSNCTNLCQRINQTKEDFETMTDFCNNLWEKIPSQSFTHQTICIVLGTLFMLSIVEGLLESYFGWMPYNRLYEGTKFGPGHINNNTADDEAAGNECLDENSESKVETTACLST